MLVGPMGMTRLDTARTLASRGLMWRYAGKTGIDYQGIALEGNGIAMRAFTLDDLPRLLEILRDPDVVRFSHLPRRWRTEEGAREYLRSLPRLASAGRRIDLAIEALRPGWMVGRAALRAISWRRRCAEVATWVAPEARGNGIASAAMRILSDWAFLELRLLRVQADPDRENLASQRMLERAGFRAERVVGLDDGRTVVMYGRCRATTTDA
jgi:RimJ/RimL family protein N-acetyltransferase